MDNSIKKDLAHLRENYTKSGISDEDLPADPMPMFSRWIEEAIHVEAKEPNAMSLATVSEDGRPNVRVVLLKGIEDNTIEFFTNYLSKKGKELEKNPQAAVAFWWPELERQVRIRGPVEKLSREKNEAYFQSRPRESQIGAWVSDQSTPVESREVLKEIIENVTDRFEGSTVPTPPFWGGYSIKIEEIEFWQGRPARLHDRILYTRYRDRWQNKRLHP